MGEGFWLGEVRRRDDFAVFSLAGLRVLYLLADGAERSGDDLSFYARDRGVRLSYQQARVGSRNLLDTRADGTYREWGTWQDPTIPDTFAYENVRNGRAHCKLTPLGLERAARMIEIVGEQGVDWLQPGAKAATPPDPITPLWEVHTEVTKFLVIATDAAAAIALVEREVGEEASRAVAVTTDSERILLWDPS